MARSRKRFIAGATCPSCKAQDTLMVFIENNTEHVTCVECGYAMSEDDKRAEKSNGLVSADQVIGIFKPR